MKGQLSKHPAVELVHEIVEKSLSGRLQLQHERLKAVIYFEEGALIYAASNARPVRLREYLLQAGVAASALARYDDQRSDVKLAKALGADGVVSAGRLQQIQLKQITDVVRLALSWGEGEWDFDPRARLDAAPTPSVAARPLLLEASRRTTPKLVASRFTNPAELISAAVDAAGPASPIRENLLPVEGFLLSRLERPAPLRDLLAVSGVPESETLVHLYSLALAGLVQREGWKNVLGFQRRTVPAPPPKPESPTAAEPVEEKPDEISEAKNFLEQLSQAQTYYEVLGVSRESTAEQMKVKYYDLARRYHPDRFRRADAALGRRLESAFARVTQAYDTLHDDRVRANYDAKLKARAKAQQLAESAPKPSVPVAEKTAADNKTTPETQAAIAERAEQQFKEGYAALESGQRKLALGLFASAASAVPKEPRYRAYYGRVLAEQQETRRAAETEFQAALKLDPNNAEYRVMLAELYRDLGFMLRARGEAERAIAADPNNARARDLLHALKSL